MDSVRLFVTNATLLNAEQRTKHIVFDFSSLEFIEPVGVVALSNAVEFLRSTGIKVTFENHKKYSRANKYLDDAGFFRFYLNRDIFINATARPTTVPLIKFKANAYVPYLYQQLMPWIGQEVNLGTESLETIKTCLEEIFHNIDYHSGVKFGVSFSQYFPKSKRIHIAISDFGRGIPSQVQSVLPELDDAQCVRKAIQEGFSTKSNVRNRGAGLPNLIRYVTQRNSGTVLIHSGHGYLSATRGPLVSSITSRRERYAYPGTLVQVVLRTDTLERLENDVEAEDFRW